MARNSTPRGKIVRRFGVNIYGQPKFDRLLEKKPHPPGKPAKSRTKNKISDYGKQLTEKQKFRFSYGISERQFRNIYNKAKKMGGITGNKMIELLECRLDNVIYRLGWAASRSQARQIVSHKHIMLNSVCNNIPSAAVSPGDIITVKNRKGLVELIRKNLAENRPSAPWLKAEADNLQGTLLAVPNPEDTQPAGNIQLVIEYYSRM